MNRHSLTINLSWLAVLISVLLLSSCISDEQSEYRKLRNYADQIKVVDTHEHQHRTDEVPAERFRFYQLLASSYLASDVISAGSPGFDMKLLDSLSLDDLWIKYGAALDHTRSTSYYGQFVKGFRKLYGLDDPCFTKENIRELSERIEENYRDYSTWFDNSFNTAGFKVMFLDQYWNPFNTEIDTVHFALVFNINLLISDAARRPEKGGTLKSMYKQAQEAGHDIGNLDDYLKFCDYLFRKNKERNAVCIKNSQAYSRTLFYEDVPYEEANRLFDKPSSELNKEEVKKLEDFMFHWIIKEAVSLEMPVQIHTGYLAGNGNTLDNGQPTKLNNLFLKYPEAKFDLFHGGFPWTGEFAALGKMFPNVYLNLVWLPQISRTEAVRSLDVVLDCVPYNKLFWGGDCNLIEESVGSLEYGKDVVSEVLAKRISKGRMTEEVALDIIRKIFRENAVEAFRLK
jgi:hypothetical protein